MSESSVTTPCTVMFEMMKRHGGISHRDMASMVLSGKPLADGQSPVSRVNDRSWVSRFIVHAPVGTLQERYFADFSVSALRVTARLKAKRRKGLASQQILELICGQAGQDMVDALRSNHQDTTLYRNLLQRLMQESGFTVDERAEIAMVLFIAAGCTGDVRKAVSSALSFSQGVHGVGMATPLVTPDSVTPEPSTGALPRPTLGLLRIVDGYTTGAPHWLDLDGATSIGSLALEDGAVNDVAVDVSGLHASIYLGQDGRWYVQGEGSKHGTVLVRGTDHAQVVVEPPRADRKADETFAPVPIAAGDELVLGTQTRFLVMEGLA